MPKVIVAYRPASKSVVRGTVTGIVRDLNGTSVPGIGVQALGITPDATGRTDVTTDSAGAFSFTAEPGRYRIVAAADPTRGAGSVDVYLSVGETARLSLTVAPQASVRGRVLVRGTGAALPGATVLARAELPICSDTSGSQRVATSSADGGFVIDGLMPGPLSLVAFSGNLRAGIPVRVLLGAGGHAENADILLEEGYTISGVLTAAGQGAIPAVGVQLYALDGETGDVVSARDPSDADGAFRLEGLVRGPYSIWASNGGRFEEAAPRVQVVDSPVSGLKISLSALAPRQAPSRPAGGIAGHVVGANGEPIANAAVAVSRDIVVDNPGPVGRAGEPPVLEDLFRFLPVTSGGSFFADDLPVGHYRMEAQSLLIQPRASPKTKQVSGTSLELSVGAIAADMRPVLSGCDDALAGTVQDEGGAGDVWVGAFASGGATGRSLLVGAAIVKAPGKFRIPALCRRAYGLAAFGLQSLHMATRTVVAPDSSTLIRLAPAASVEGSATWQGSPVRHYAIDVLGVAGSTLRWQVSEDAGQFRLADVSIGEYDVVIEAAEGFAEESIALGPGPNRPIRVSLSPWASLRGRIAPAGAWVKGPFEISLLLDSGNGRAEGGPATVPRAGIAETTADDDGGFGFDRVWSRRARVSVRAHGSLRLVSSRRPGVVSQPGWWLDVNLAPGRVADLGDIIVE